MAELRGEEKKAQRRAIPERKKPVTKTTFSGNRLCFSLWLCRSLNFAALRLMTRLFQPNGLFDQVSGKKKRPPTKFCVLVAWQPAGFLGNRCSVGVMICSNTVHQAVSAFGNLTEKVLAGKYEERDIYTAFAQFAKIEGALPNYEVPYGPFGTLRRKRRPISTAFLILRQAGLVDWTGQEPLG